MMHNIRYQVAYNLLLVGWLGKYVTKGCHGMHDVSVCTNWSCSCSPTVHSIEK